jgi:hypothetical protein
MPNAHPNNAQRVVDVNGRLTTVYKRPEGAVGAPNRLSTVTPAHKMVSMNTELNSHAGGNYVSIRAANSESGINRHIADTPEDESPLFMVSDSTLNQDGSLNIDGGASPVLIHLDTLRTANVNIRSGHAVIKSYSERHIPNINVSGDAHVTVIIAEGTGAEVTSEEDATATIVPESGAFGTVYIKGSNPAEIDDEGVKHQMIVLG